MSPRDQIDVVVEDVGRAPLPIALKPLTCPLLDEELLWCTRASIDLVAGGMLVTLAPAGRHSDHQQVLLPFPLVREWEIHEAEQLLGRLIWREKNPRRPELPLKLLPRAHVGPRPLLLAESPAAKPWGGRALEDVIGNRLASALGTTLPALLASFETRYLLEYVNEPRLVALRRLDQQGYLHDRFVIVVGARTATMLGGGEEVTDLRMFGGHLAGVVPSPTSNSLGWVLPGAAQVARELCLDALLAVRPPPQIAANDLADARAGLWCGWQGLADAGVTGHSPVPGHGFRPRRADLAQGERVAWSRRWSGGCADVAPDGKGLVLTIDHDEGQRFGMRGINDLLEAIKIAEAFAVCHGFREVAGEVADAG